MSVLQYNEIKEKKVIVYNDEPCEVLESHVARTQQRKPQNQVKLKSLINGRTFNETFRSSEQVEEAEIDKKEIKFLYHNKGEYWFCDPKNPRERFLIKEDIIGSSGKFLKENATVTALTWGEDEEEKIIKISLPIKMEFLVKEAPPSIKGNTASGGNKVVILENGVAVNAPLFINAGERIIVNTETGEYSERV
ncbi:MAG: elongation factor P [Candidatus Paceibacterota bacterium]|jgi:elongation factor P